MVGGGGRWWGRLGGAGAGWDREGEDGERMGVGKGEKNEQCVITHILAA